MASNKKLPELDAASTVDFIYGELAGVSKKITSTNVVAQGGVTLAASKLLGRGSAGGTGHAEAITLGTNLSMSGATLNAAGANLPYVFLSDFGAVGNGTTDDTAAINACFASVVGTGATVIIAPGQYKITDTIIIGDSTGGAGADTSFISIECPGRNGATQFQYAGDADRPIVLFAKNKYFTCTGLNVENHSARGTTTGMMLGGGGPGASGTQTLSAVFVNCSISNCHVGIQDGNDGACSEILWEQLSLIANDTGWTVNDFNSLDHMFFMLNMSDNTIGLDSGSIENFWVTGGSATNVSGTDFFVRANASNVTITNYRSEAANVVVKGDPGSGGGRVTVQGCLFKQPFPNGTLQGASIAGNFLTLSINDSECHGFVSLGTAGDITMINNKVPIYVGTGLPFSLRAGPSDEALAHVFLRNNIDYAFPPTISPDLDGFFKQTAAGGGGPSPFFESVTYGTGFQKVKQEHLPVDTGIPFATDTILLGYVRQLAEGPTPNADVIASFDEVTNALTAIGNNTLHFASVPATVAPGLGVAGTGMAAETFVLWTTATTVVLSTNVVAPGVGNGDTITFGSVIGVPTPGNNLRIMGQFATSATLVLAFQRTISTDFSNGEFTALGGDIFFKSDVGKPIESAGNGTGGWTDWHGAVYSYVDSTHVLVDPASMPNTAWSAQDVVIGADEPDENYMVVITGNANETFWVDTITASSFTVHSSNASSTATVVALIVR